MKKGLGLMTAVMSAIYLNGGKEGVVRTKLFHALPTWKPRFTEGEIKELRSLPKRERELRVRELRSKYLAAKGGV